MINFAGEMKRTETKRILISLIPVAVLVALLAFDIYLFGSDAILGASQVSLLFSAGICVWLAMWLFKTPWDAFEEAIKSNIGDVTTAIVILFLIGGISGTWTMSGTIPTLICYGVKIISPKIFLFTACIICAICSLMTGSSWTTIATLGVALIGIGRAMGFNEALVAGAIISGAYFGDKISPLSDTTVMASSVAGTPLFTHIRYMLYTTVPSMAIALVIYLILGFTGETADASQISVYTETLENRFNINGWTLVVPIITAIMIFRKAPALMVLGISTLLAGISSLILQPHIITELGTETYEVMGYATEGSKAGVMFAGLVRSVYDTVSIETGIPEVNALVSSRGMLGMLNTVYLIICAMCFGGCMKASGMLQSIASMMIPLTKTRAGLVTSTVTTGVVLNSLVCDQYLSIILSCDIYKGIYKKRGYENRLLSRSAEDSCTVTSPLIPWSSCGMTQSTVLGVATIAYLPFSFFNLISPLMSILVGITGYKIRRIKPDEMEGDGLSKAMSHGPEEKPDKEFPVA